MIREYWMYYIMYLLNWLTVQMPNHVENKNYYYYYVQYNTKIEKFVILTPNPGFRYKGCWLNPGGVTKSWSQPITSRGSEEHFELYTTWMTWQSESPPGAFPNHVRGCSSKFWGVYSPRDSRWTIPQTWPVTCEHGSDTPLQKLDDWKGGSDEDQITT